MLRSGTYEKRAHVIHTLFVITKTFIISIRMHTYLFGLPVVVSFKMKCMLDMILCYIMACFGTSGTISQRESSLQPPGIELQRHGQHS